MMLRLDQLQVNGTAAIYGNVQEAVSIAKHQSVMTGLKQIETHHQVIMKKSGRFLRISFDATTNSGCMNYDIW